MRLPDLIDETEQAFQNIEKRPFDRFAIGPFMIWFGLRSKTMNKWPRRVLVAGGIYQIIYAWREYKNLAKAIQTGPKEAFAVLQKNTIYEGGPLGN